MEKKNVKCPKCGIKQMVTNSDGATQKVISCCNCGAKLRVKFEKPVDNGFETILPPMPGDKSASVPPPPPSSTPSPVVPGRGPIGMNCPLALLCNGKRYPLQPGLNKVGRISKTIMTDVPLEVKDMTISRYHSLIEVQGVNDGTFRALISNGQNKNVTYVNSTPIQGSDKIVLKNGDVIQMGETPVQFIC